MLGIIRKTLSLCFLSYGILATYNLCQPMHHRISLPFLQYTILSGPALLVIGLFFVGKTFGKSYRSIYFVMIMGVSLMVIGAYPWIYASYFVGARPGDETAGMLGTLVFVLVGIPGIALTLIAMIYGAIGWMRKMWAPQDAWLSDEEVMNNKIDDKI